MIGLLSNQRTIRATPNPLDVSTVVSILPKPIHEVKPTIQPGIFDIGAGTYENPAILNVGSSSWWREVDDEMPLLEIPVSSVQVANSIVMDYCNGLICCNMGDTMPGLFFLPGNHSVLDIKTKFKAELDKAQEKQKRWFAALVKMADILWARSNGNPLAISEDARLAAAELNLRDKEWLKDSQTVELVRCVSCGSLRNQNYPVCPTCKAIADPVKAKSLNLQFAQ